MNSKIPANDHVHRICLQNMIDKRRLFIESTYSFGSVRQYLVPLDQRIRTRSGQRISRHRQSQNRGKDPSRLAETNPPTCGYVTPYCIRTNVRSSCVIFSILCVQSIDRGPRSGARPLYYYILHYFSSTNLSLSTANSTPHALSSDRRYRDSSSVHLILFDKKRTAGNNTNQP